MKKISLSVSLLSSALLLCGYSSAAWSEDKQPEAPFHSLEWFKQHEAERAATVEACKKMAHPRGTEECRNAIDASFRGGSYTKSKPQSW